MDHPPDPFDGKKFLFEQYENGETPQSAFRELRNKFGAGSLSLRVCHDYFADYRRKSRKRAQREDTPPMETFKIRRVGVLWDDDESSDDEDDDDDSDDEDESDDEVDSEDEEVDIFTMDAMKKADQLVQQFVFREIVPENQALVKFYKDVIIFRTTTEKIAEFKKLGARTVITPQNLASELFPCDYVDLALTTLMKFLKHPALKFSELCFNLRNVNGYDDQDTWGTFLQALHQVRGILPTINMSFTFRKPHLYERIQEKVQIQTLSFQCKFEYETALVPIEELEDAATLARERRKPLRALFANFTF
ncbi:hypothetical protein CAEBREN_09782 [Caenorhabditis brenneri]|uniref:Uncharacterized protein n=1 Tax=Caenorhabditis brenneri TaxID=135651 RepID=G0MX55_CAEBE|nr:hypothetical protein CAEBREN_09782 [Caenorhabditis brenneri]